MPSPGQSVHPLTGSRNARRRLRLVSRLGRAAQSAEADSSPVAAVPADCAAATPDGASSLATVRDLLQSAPAVTWVFAGDSITHGALYTEGRRSFVEHFGERVRWELRRFDDVVINTGVCGERTEGLLANLDRRVSRFQPDIALVLLGMNDSLAGPAGRTTFRRNLEEIVSRIRGAAAIPVLQTPNTVYPPNAVSRSDLPAYVDIVREVAIASDIPLVDHWRAWQDSCCSPQALLEWLQDESIHPNHVGHREMARLIFRAFDIFDPASLTCGCE